MAEITIPAVAIVTPYASDWIEAKRMMAGKPRTASRNRA